MSSELSLALYGAWRLARLDRSGLAFFDRSVDGFWRSFRAALIVYPAFLVMLPLRIDEAAWERSGALRIILVETIGYVIIWTAYPLALLPVVRWLGRENRFFDYMVVYNWVQVLETGVMLFVNAVALGGLASGRSGDVLLIVVTLVLLGYEWFIARVALDVPGGPATLVVLLNFALVMATGRIAHGLY